MRDAVVVTGSRSWRDRATIQYVLENVRRQVETVIVGDADGADKIVWQIGRRLGLDVEVFRADWDTYGKAAGPRRNREMLNSRPLYVVAFWDGESRGTLDCLREACVRGIRVEVYPAGWAT